MKSSKLKLIATVAFLGLLSTSLVKAGYNDPWWLLFKVKGGQLIQKKGPYDSKYACLAEKYSLEFSQEFIGCVQ